ncbi:MAG TPA: MFS transporter [Pirellulales bacterium]|jgi:EmrB/QacA subfamily drug resistance transporter|nr:MFS transporter [Pirellulales bacterium]
MTSPTAEPATRQESQLEPDCRTWHGIPVRFLAAAAVTPALIQTGINSTVTDLARPFLVSELASDRYRYQWVTGATLLGAVAGMSLIGWMRARFGLKRAWITGLVIYTIGSLACATTPNSEFLVLARFVQSWGNGMAVATVQAILWREFPRHRDAALSLYVLGLYFGRIFAPSLSAWLISNFPSWRSIFLWEVPFESFAIVFTSKLLQPDKPGQEQPRPFDFPGFVLLLFLVTCLMLALFRFQKWGWQTSSGFWLVAGLGVLALTAFLVRELTVPEPLLDLRLFAVPRFALCVSIKAIFDTNFLVIVPLLTVYLAVTRDYMRSTAGLVFLPAVAAMGTSLALGARYGHRANRKIRLIFGLATMAAGSWLLSGLDLFTDKRWTAAAVAILGFGAGMVASPVVCIPLEGLDQQQVASSASIKNLFRVLPSFVGSGLISILIERRTDARFDSMRQLLTPNRPPTLDVYRGLVDYFTLHGFSPGDAAAQARGVISQFLRDNATVYADEAAFQYLAILAAVGAALACLLRAISPDAPGPKRG